MTVMAAMMSAAREEAWGLFIHIEFNDAWSSHDAVPYKQRRSRSLDSGIFTSSGGDRCRFLDCLRDGDVQARITLHFDARDSSWPAVKCRGRDFAGETVSFSAPRENHVFLGNACDFTLRSFVARPLR